MPFPGFGRNDVSRENKDSPKQVDDFLPQTCLSKVEESKVFNREDNSFPKWMDRNFSHINFLQIVYFFLEDLSVLRLSFIALLTRFPLPEYKIIFGFISLNMGAGNDDITLVLFTCWNRRPKAPTRRYQGRSGKARQIETPKDEYSPLYYCLFCLLAK